MSDLTEQDRLRHTRAGEVFKEVCDLPEAERSHAIDAACAGDDALAEAVRSLFEFDGTTGDALSEQRLDPRERFSAVLQQLESDAPPPPVVGRYRLVRRIGVGGMGEVHEAQQESPSRTVALKLLTGDPHARQLVRRFVREGQIQGQLSHPGIAAVYEAGIHTEAGRSLPYLAMEFVDGVPITVHFSTVGHTIRQRIEAMLEVCNAVSHAHQRGVIHRDLKPDNILVVRSDSAPRVKVLDFGVAKSLGSQSIAASMRTEAGLIVGTIAYMSPEQFRGGGTDVDTRSDIYALGLILYELLAGQPAHETKGLTLPEAARRVTEVDPPRLGAIVPTARGDLETIVSKAMDRDRARRYASVSELDEDLRRFLRNEPVLARPSSPCYLFRKFAARNRALVSVSALALAALIAGIVGTTLQTRAAVLARDESLRQAERAAHKSRIADAVAESLRQVFYLAAPNQAKGSEPTLRESIAKVDGLFGEGYDGPPEAEAIVRNVAGIVHRNFGEFDKAREQFEKSLAIRRRVLAPGSTEIADSLQNIATLLSMSGRPAEALPVLSEALEIQRRTLGEHDPAVLRSMFNLARAELRLGHNETALRLTRESLELHTRAAPENAEVLGMHHEQIAAAQRALGHMPEAERSAVRAVELVRSAVGGDHPTLAAALICLARTRLAAGDAKGADSPSREAQGITDRVFASRPDHPTVAAARQVREAVVSMLNEPASPPSER